MIDREIGLRRDRRLLTVQGRVWTARIFRECASRRLLHSSRLLPVRFLVALLALPFMAACTESIDGGEACPLLCPGRQNEFRDTVIDVVVRDTSVGDFPTSGLLSQLILADRGDTLRTSVVVRYDVVPSSYRPVPDADSVAITAIDSVWMHLLLDRKGSRGDTPVTIEAFDVDTAVSDSVTAVVQSLFRPERLLGSVTVIPASAGDSLRVPLDPEKILARVANRKRIRVGLRMTGGGQLRIESLVIGTGIITLNIVPRNESAASPIRVVPLTLMDDVTTELQYAYTAYNIIDLGTPAAADGQLSVGGIRAKRTYLEFDLPRYYMDSATIVRAELLLDQIPTPYADRRDTVELEVLIPVTTGLVTDLRRSLDLASLGYLIGLEPARLAAADSGQVVINVLGVVRGWRNLPRNVPRALGLMINGEGTVPLDARFHSRQGASGPSVRPRLRITYLPRSEFARP